MRVVKRILIGAFLLVVIALAILAGVSTSFITGDRSERTSFMADNLVLNVAIVAVVLGLAWIALAHTGSVRARINDDERLFRIVRGALLSATAAVTAAWVLATQAIPGSDALYVQQAVANALNGDYSAFANDAYMGTYLNQAGLFWISYLFALVAGPQNYVAFQLFNAAGAVLAVKLLGDIGGLLGASRMQQLGVIALCIAFFPFLQYTSFVYGIVWGLALSLLAIKYEMLFFERRAWRYAIVSAVSICVAVMFKGNYAVFLIAMVLYAALELLRSRSARVLAIVAMLVGAFALQAVVPLAAARSVSGYPLDEGCSSWSWVAMGLQDSSRAPGWYNKYNAESYKKAGFDSKKQAEAAKEQIARSLQQYADNPAAAMEFFEQKTASQWNNPTFQGFWNVQVRDSAIEQGAFTKWLLSEQGANTMASYLNYVQFFILLGAVLWCVSALSPTLARTANKQGPRAPATPRHAGSVREMSGEELRAVILPLVFLGGFLCHLFWEAKCQYTIPYFELLLPLAVIGYARFLSLARAKAEKKPARPISAKKAQG